MKVEGRAVSQYLVLPRLDGVEHCVNQLRRFTRAGRDAATRAHIISAIMFLTKFATGDATKSIEELLTEMRTLIQVLLPTP